MNYIDIILVIPMLYGIIRGFYRGFVLELTGLVGWIAGAIIAIKYHHLLESFLIKQFSLTSPYDSIIAFVVTFLIVVLFVFIVGKLTTRLINYIALTSINRILGGILGLVKWGFIAGILVFIFNYVFDYFNILPKDVLDKSFLYEPVLNVIEGVVNKLGIGTKVFFDF